MRSTCFPPLASALCALFALTLLFSACDLPSTSPSDLRVSAERLIAEDPQARFSAESLLEDQELFVWDFREGWQYDVPAGEAVLSRDGLKLQTAKRYIPLERKTNLRAEEVDSFELVLRGFHRQPMQLQWHGPGEKFSQDNRLIVRLGQKTPESLQIFRFALRGHPGWKGEIAAIRVGIQVPRGGNTTALSLRALRSEVRPASLADAVARSWKVELDGDLRDALLALPGLDVEHEIALPRRAPEIRVAFGMDETVASSIDFQVGVRRADDGETRFLFQESLQPGVRGWREARVDLAEFAGENVALVLRAAAEETPDPRTGLSFWGHPEVLQAPDDEPPPNVILISLDTLRADHVSAYGYERETTPVIDAWARDRATLFEEAVASAPWTLPSHTSLFTGLDAIRHRVNHNLPAPRSLQTLSEYLRAAGYAPMAITGGGFMHPQYGLGQGFEKYRAHSVQMGASEEIDDGVALASEWLKAHADRPFFLFFHTYEAHNPFNPRPALEELTGRKPEDFTVDVQMISASPDDGYLRHRGIALRRGADLLDERPEDLDQIAVDLYDSGIAYADAKIGELFALLDELDLTRRTLIVLTSDHGELFGEHDAYNHVSVYEENLLVPLIIADPGGRGAGGRVSEQVRSIDVLPTILELLDLPAPRDVDGVSLAPLMSGDKRPGGTADLAWSYAADSNYGVSLRRGGKAKYVFRNVPWDTVDREERTLDLRRGGEIDDAEADRLRRLTESMLRELLFGVRVLFAHPDDATRPSDFEISGVTATRFKSLRPGSNILRSSHGGTTAALSLSPGESAEYVLEHRTPAPLKIRVDGAELIIDTENLEGVAWIRRDGDSSSDATWRLEMIDELPDEPRGVYLWWNRRPDPESDAASAEVDEALQQQLRDLGYL